MADELPDNLAKDGRLPGSGEPVTALAPASQVEPASGLEQSRSSHGAGFTPGPWKVEVERSNYIGGTSSVLICCTDREFPDSQLARVSIMDGLGEREANARLIAAAPDLYEALAIERARLEDELNDILADIQEGRHADDRDKKRIDQIHNAFAALSKVRARAAAEQAS